jgi:hypothetical protein
MAGQSTFAGNLLMARTRTGRAERAKALRTRFESQLAPGLEKGRALIIASDPELADC